MQQDESPPQGEAELLTAGGEAEPRPMTVMRQGAWYSATAR
jgi:hypothetical protein